MQSQQKRVKWSRGETATALQERTDTGITQVSAESMKNVICDIYGNVSRRPALKIVDSITETPIILGTDYAENNLFVKTFVFTITVNKYVVFIATKSSTQGFLIENNKFVKKINIAYDSTQISITLNEGETVSQYNNYMVVGGRFIIRKTDDDNFIAEKYIPTTPWHAINGTHTKQIGEGQIEGGFVYASSTQYGANTIYLYANLVVDTLPEGVTDYITINIGDTMPIGSWLDKHVLYNNYYYSYKLVELNSTQSKLVFRAVPKTGGIVTGDVFSGTMNGQTRSLGSLNFNSDNAGFTSYTYTDDAGTTTVYKQIDTGLTLELENTIKEAIPAGSIVQFPNLGAYMRVEGYYRRSTVSPATVIMYGALLTPAADQTKQDKVVKVEYGYDNLEEYHPIKLTFSNQRLYAAGWTTENSTENPIVPGFAVGSQIGRYNDFKNDYNLENEPVTIDIATAYQEQILYMSDYNGLKIFTDSAEYAYSQQSGIVKQSENGSKSDCQPIVFGSLLLYADKSNRQIRAMQYEFGQNIFASSVINTFTQEDLIFNTTSMAGFVDKEHYTGRFLYCTQTPQKYGFNSIDSNMHSFAVCNLVPENQSMIWTRWETPIYQSTDPVHPESTYNTIVQALEINNKIWFVVQTRAKYDAANTMCGYSLAELDYNKTLDFETTAQPTDTIAKIGTANNIDLVLANTDVAVFDGDKYMWTDHTNDIGEFTKPLTDLQNAKYGCMINAEIISHPIDIAGKTNVINKRIAKANITVRNTEPGAVTLNHKYGYMSIDKKIVNYYNCTGMKREVRYTINNIQGARFTIESLVLDMEYGTLDN